MAHSASLEAIRRDADRISVSTDQGQSFPTKILAMPLAGEKGITILSVDVDGLLAMLGEVVDEMDGATPITIRRDSAFERFALLLKHARQYNLEVEFTGTVE